MGLAVLTVRIAHPVVERVKSHGQRPQVQREAGAGGIRHVAGDGRALAQAVAGVGVHEVFHGGQTGERRGGGQGLYVKNLAVRLAPGPVGIARANAQRVEARCHAAQRHRKGHARRVGAPARNGDGRAQAIARVGVNKVLGPHNGGQRCGGCGRLFVKQLPVGLAPVVGPRPRTDEQRMEARRNRRKVYREGQRVQVGARRGGQRNGRAQAVAGVGVEVVFYPVEGRGGLGVQGRKMRHPPQQEQQQGPAWPDAPRGAYNIHQQ